MIEIRYELSGAFEPHATALRQAAAAVVKAHTEGLANAIRQSFEETKSGAQGVRDDGSTYTASAPGEAPAIKEGELWGSIEQAMLSDLVGAVWTDDEKAAWLNYGTDTIEPRPFWEPALDAARQPFYDDMQALERRLGR